MQISNFDNPLMVVNIIDPMHTSKSYQNMTSIACHIPTLPSGEGILPQFGWMSDSLNGYDL